MRLLDDKKYQAKKSKKKSKKINNEREKPTQKSLTREKLTTNSTSTLKNTTGAFFLCVEKFYKMTKTTSEKKIHSNEKK